MCSTDLRINDAEQQAIRVKEDDYSTLIAPIRHRMVNSIWRIAANADDTEDILQEVLASIIRRFDRVRAHANPTALILRMCINHALDHVRRRRIRTVGLEDAPDEALVHDAPAPAELLIRQEERAVVLEALGRLPRREAEAILLVAIEDQPYCEAARAMQCRESTVRVLITKARKRLRAMLGEGRDAKRERTGTAS